MSNPNMHFTPFWEPKSAIVAKIAAERGIPVIDIKLAEPDEPIERLEAKADLFFYERSFD